MKIEVRNLCFGYGPNQVLKGISFTAREGEMLSILGPNSAGKSTLFKCILGLLKGYKGEIYAGDIDVNKLLPRDLAHLIAYIPQSHHPTFNYSVLDVVMMGTANSLNVFSSPGKKEIAKALAALEKIGVDKLAQKSYLKLSGGEQQLVLIARAIAQQSKALLMDEPTSSLDFGNQLQILKELKRLSEEEGYTVFMSLHNPQHALHYSDSVMAMNNGRVIAQGSPHEVMDEALLKQLYNVDVHFINTDDGRIISPIIKSEAGNDCIKCGTYSR